MLKINKVCESNTWRNPLPGITWAIPLGKNHPAGFGSRRKYGFHTGLDLYCKHNQELVSVENGTIVAITDFGKNKKNKSPWLNKTRVILIEGKTGVVAYCNVRELETLKPGQKVKAGEKIGNVISIFKKKSKKNACMLHLELYASGTKRRVFWADTFPKPPQLLDPTPHLLDIIVEQQVVYKRR